MKKTAITALAAAMVLSMSSITAFAAGSATVATVEAPVATQTATTSIDAVAAPEAYVESTTVSEGFKAAAVSATTVQSAAVAVQNEILNDIASIGAALGNNTLAQAASNPSMKVTATLRSVVDVSPTSATKNAAGNYVVTLASSYVGNGTIIVLHYNGTTWDPIVPTSVANGAVTFETPSLSPIAIVEVNVATAATSPKTGETVPAAMMFVLIGAVGAAVCTKKAFN